MTQLHLENTSILPERVQQPGPVGLPYTIAGTRLEELDIVLPAHISIEDALGLEIEARELAGAYLRIKDAEVNRMQYVIPALPPDDEHVAWFSESYSPLMPGRIEDASIVCGSLLDKYSFHCHGQLSDVDQEPTMGHLLLDTCYLTTPTRLTGFGFKDARFIRRIDPETNFDLLMPESINERSKFKEGMLVRIAPNIEISSALIECCQSVGWKRASVHGVGSLIGAHFDDGRVLNSFATEYMVNSGTVDLTGSTPHVELNITLVGLGGVVMQGRLAAKNNPVLITSELVLKNITGY